MMTKVFDLLRSLGWYLVHFIYDLIDGLLQIIKKLNAIIKHLEVFIQELWQ